MKKNKKFTYRNGNESSHVSLIKGFGERNPPTSKKLVTLDILLNQCTDISEEV